MQPKIAKKNTVIKFWSPGGSQFFILGGSGIFEEDFCMGRIFDVFDQTSVFSGSTACFVVFWGVGRDDF
mgnify:CR=1 FL=1